MGPSGSLVRTDPRAVRLRALEDPWKTRRLATAVWARTWLFEINLPTEGARWRCCGQGGDYLDRGQGGGEFLLV
jgi:hypothetical protein